MRNLTAVLPTTAAGDAGTDMLPPSISVTTIGSRALLGPRSLLGGADSVPGRFIALEGTDGVGKTSLARALADIGYDGAIDQLTQATPPLQTIVAGRPLVFVPRRQISATSIYAAKLMEHLSTMLWHSGDAPDLSDAFWVSLQAAWFTAHTETVIGPVLDAGCDVIVDGWLYKFFAKLLLQGFTEPDLAVIFDRVRMPDAVVLLQADAGAVYDRRGTFRPAELGMHASYGGLDDLGRDTFIDYQTRTARNLQMLADRNGWRTAQLDPGEPIPVTASRLAPIIAELRTPRESTLISRAARNEQVPR